MCRALVALAVAVPRKPFAAPLAFATGVALVAVAGPFESALAQKTVAPKPTPAVVDFLFPGVNHNSTVNFVAKYRVDEAGSNSESAPTLTVQLTIVGQDASFGGPGGPWNTATVDGPPAVVLPGPSPDLYYIVIPVNLSAFVPEGFIVGDVSGVELMLNIDRPGWIAGSALVSGTAHAEYTVFKEAAVGNVSPSRAPR